MALPAKIDTAQNYLNDRGIHVELTHDRLSIQTAMDIVRSPKAGAIVLFAGTPPFHTAGGLQLSNQPGTTRDNTAGKPVQELRYSAYVPLALKTMLAICRSVQATYSLSAICMIHRLGVVPIGEESILVAVSSPHREPAWRAGEQALEECKAKVEVWKLEEFGGDEGSVWRANRDGAGGVSAEPGPGET
jgi:molybdopterin synthase catalytic subunit